MTYKTQGIILRTQDWQDSSRFYTFLTPDYGKISAIARGVRKIKSKQNGKLKTFAVLELMLANGRKVDTLATAEIIKDFSNLHHHLLVFGLASFCLDLVDNFLEEGQRDIPVFLLLKEILTILDRRYLNHRADLESAVWGFALDLICKLGYRPDFRQCGFCHQPLKTDVKFWSEKLSLICGHHLPDLASSISHLAIEQLKTFSLGFRRGLKINLVPDSISLIRQFIYGHLGRPLKTERFLAKIISG